MRLINADALKERFDDYIKANPNISGVFELGKFIIDNAPTVELTEEQAIDKLYETGWIIRHDKEMTERPQGEWIGIDEFPHEDYECNYCGHSLFAVDISEYNFCPNCGADMRGTANDT